MGKISDMEKIRKICNAGPKAVIGRLIYLYKKNRKLTERNTKLTERIKKLESQLAKNSTNSGNPPSSDGLDKPSPKSLKDLNKGQRKPNGGQPGHEGRNLKMSDNPDVIKILENTTCKKCSTSLVGKDAVGYEKRQEYELVIKLLVVEHRAERKQCDCGTTNLRTFRSTFQRVRSMALKCWRFSSI